MLSKTESLDLLDAIQIAEHEVNSREEDDADKAANTKYYNGLRDVVRRETRVDEPTPLPLTDRETEVFRLIANGLDGHEISAKLDIDYKTYSSHRSHIMRKLGLKGRGNQALLIWAIRNGHVVTI